MRNTDDLIKKATEKVESINADNYLGYQIKQHINLYRSTGLGQEVLEHYLQHDRHYVSHKVFYYNGIIIDRNVIEYKFYSKANRHGEWLMVRKILPKKGNRRTNPV